MARSRWKTAIAGALRVSGLCRPLAKSLHRIGADRLSRRVGAQVSWLPNFTRVMAPSEGARSSFRMSTAGGSEPIARTIWWNGLGVFEPPMPRLWYALCANADVILDVGAYTGLYSLLAACQPGRRRVVAFEPLPAVRAVLEENIRESGLDDQIEVRSQAVGSTPRTAALYLPSNEMTAGGLTTTASLNPEFRPHLDEGIPVDVVTLDGFADESGIEGVDLVKIDVESLEEEVAQLYREIADAAFEGAEVDEHDAETEVGPDPERLDAV